MGPSPSLYILFGLSFACSITRGTKYSLSDTQIVIVSLVRALTISMDGTPVMIGFVQPIPLSSMATVPLLVLFLTSIRSKEVLIGAYSLAKLVFKWKTPLGFVSVPKCNR